MRGMLVSEVSFGRRIGVLDALLLPFLWMNGGPRYMWWSRRWRGAVSRREFVAAAGDGYRGCKESARDQRGYDEPWVEEHC